MSIFNANHRRELDNLVEEYTTSRVMARREFLRRATAAGLSLSAASALFAACGGPASSGGPNASGNVPTVKSIDIMTEWGGSELESFTKITDAYTAKTKIDVKIESSRDLPTLLQTRVRANNPPDIVGMPNLDLFH